MPTNYEDEPDEQPKRRHHWGQPVAGFVELGDGYPLGKCPSTLTVVKAGTMLSEAIPWSPRSWNKSHPKRFYAVLDGVVYRGTATNPRKSFRGFPEHPSTFPKGAEELKRKLLDRARELGCEEGVRDWMDW